MNPEEALARLCAFAGIETEYIDGFGHRHRVSEGTLKRLLAAMGLHADSDEVLLSTLMSLEGRLLPPVVVRREDEALWVPLTVPASRVHETIAWVLSEEGGRQHGDTCRPADLERLETLGPFERYALPLPLSLPPGYHRLSIEGETMTFIVAPAMAYHPLVLAGKGRAWGPAIPLYAIRSHRNWGIGDLTDLKHVVKLCAEAGAGIIALPPLHALRHHDPYLPSSRQFFHSLALDVEAIPDFAECKEARAMVSSPEFQARLRALVEAETLDASQIEACKRPVLERLYRHFKDHHLHPGDEQGKAFVAFRDEGGEPLFRFALFDTLHRLYPEGWPEELSAPDAPAIRAFAASHEEEIDYVRYLQWRLEQQLEEAGKYCLEQGLGIGLQMTLAMGVEKGGAEAWIYPEVYAGDVRAGLPPGPDHPQGMDLGWIPPIPLALKEAAYAPFIAALRKNMRFAGALRIAHTAALERLFWFPEGAGPREGAYVSYPFEDLLGIIALESQRHQCLIVGDDLGDALLSYGMLERLLFVEERDEAGHFKAPQAYPVMASLSWRDDLAPPLAGFWKGYDLELRRKLGLFPSDKQWQSAVIARAQDRARVLVALEQEGLLPEGMGIDPAFVGAMNDALVKAVITCLARAPAKVLVFHMEDIFLCIKPAYLPAPLYGSWRKKLSVPLENWVEDLRWQGITEALRAERGVAILPAEERPSPGVMIPRATYRLQFNRQFTFQDARDLTPYLHELGISHCYASPYLKARPGSMHGYDIIDHDALNAEIGSFEDYDAWVESLERHRMGQVLDIVPNHMGVMGCDNAWWLDVLENGQASLYADYFDIDWHPMTEALRGKMLVPVLGDHYGSILGKGELKLHFAHEGSFGIRYYEHCFPIDPQTYPDILGYGLDLLVQRLGEDDPALMEFQSLINAFSHLPSHDERTLALREDRYRDQEVHKKHLAALCQSSKGLREFISSNVIAFNGIEGEPKSFALLHRLLEKQAYRLAYWRVAADEINYRRFFDINDLAGLRQENADVFEATHRFILELIASGKVHGLRIDHPDGLYDPAAYYRQLQQHICTIAGKGDGRLPCYLVIEKILAGYEQLRRWPVHGTTGYEFANLVNGLLVYGEGEKEMDQIYQRFIGERLDFDEILYACKKLIIRGALSSEMTVLANLLDRLTESDPYTRDFTLNGLREALTEVVACFPVYRTYVTGEQVTEEDRRFVEWAVAQAKKRRASGEVSIFDFIRDILLLEGVAEKDAAYRAQAVRFAMKFQQYTAPVMAKGMEDTAFYRYHRLISLNEVGGDPRRFGVSLSAFHHANALRAKHWPHAMLTLSTHDAKRSADVRARINVLTELPELWRRHLQRWSRINRRKKQPVDGTFAPSRNDEYLLYQTLIGAWPVEPLDEEGLAFFAERIEQYMLKAIKEAKQHTSWINPNQAYEEAMVHFVREILAFGSPFLADFLPFQRRIAHYGFFNSLSQVLLELTSPGVPDIYQGDELWNFTLVDPDNRRPVDYAIRRRRLKEVKAIEPRLLLDTLEDGRIKLFVIWKALELRRHDPLLFQEGDYLPLTVEGEKAEHLCALARRRGETWCLVAVPRWPVRLMGEERLPLGEVWGDTRIVLPEPLEGFENVFTGERTVSLVQGDKHVLKAKDLFASFPVALLHLGSVVTRTRAK